MAAIKRQLAEANVPAYAKIIDVSQARSELTREQVQKVADLTRSAPGETSRGPVAFVINPDRIGFANVFADLTHDERPIQLFRSLHEARAAQIADAVGNADKHRSFRLPIMRGHQWQRAPGNCPRIR